MNYDNLTRPIVGIENRTAHEVFDIMVDRIRSCLLDKPEAVGWETEAERDLEHRAFAAFNDDTLPHLTRNLILDLWQQYCLLSEPSFTLAADKEQP